MTGFGAVGVANVVPMLTLVEDGVLALLGTAICVDGPTVLLVIGCFGTLAVTDDGLAVEDGGVLIGTVGDLTVDMVGGLPVGAVFGVLFDNGMDEIVAPTVSEPVLSGPALSGFLSS